VPPRAAASLISFFGLFIELEDEGGKFLRNVCVYLIVIVMDFIKESAMPVLICASPQQALYLLVKEERY
jgi:hypothetical protein